MGNVVKVWEVAGGAYEEMSKKIAVLPVGTLERHGDHLPLGTDTIVANYIAEKVSEALNAHLFPPIWYGVTILRKEFAGSVSVDSQALYAYVKSVLKEIVRNGYKYIVVLNGHDGNSEVSRTAAIEVAYEAGVCIFVVDWWKDVAQDKKKELFTYPGHAGENETSVVLHIAPELVDMSKAKRHIHSVPSISVYSRRIAGKIWPEAMLGDATRADAVRGKTLLEAIISEIVDNVKKLMIIDS